MVWMMVMCLLPLAVLLFVGGQLSGGYVWPILIGGFVLVHVWMMSKGHRSHENDPKDKTNNADTIGNQKGRDSKSH